MSSTEPSPRAERLASERLPGVPKARLVLFAAVAIALAPPPKVMTSAWAAETRVVAAESGSPRPGKWSNDYSPQLVEVMDCLSLADPCRSVVFMKSHQVAGTEAGLNALGCIIDKTPAPCLTILPTLEEM